MIHRMSTLEVLLGAASTMLAPIQLSALERERELRPGGFQIDVVKLPSVGKDNDVERR